MRAISESWNSPLAFRLAYVGASGTRLYINDREARRARHPIYDVVVLSSEVEPRDTIFSRSDPISVFRTSWMLSAAQLP